MIALSIALMIAAFVLFVLAALGIPTPPRFALGWAGLACWVLADLLPKVAHG